jgi:CheY-like chemotaxis protein
LQLLFQLFERLGAEQTAIESTGLGLMLSKGLAEAMGGTLGVASEVDRGSTFWVGAAEGQAGLDLACADRPDLILLDLQLPDMRGEEVLRRLCAGAAWCECK